LDPYPFAAPLSEAALFLFCILVTDSRRICRDHRSGRPNSSVTQSRIARITGRCERGCFTLQKTKTLGVETLGHCDAEYDTTRRVFDGWWHGWLSTRGWLDPNGNRNVLYLNRNGAKRNLNMNWFDNQWNRNYRFAARRPRNFLHFSPACAGEFCFASCPFHPPSCLPTSSSGIESAAYRLFSSDPDSQRIMRSSFAVSSLRIASRTYGCFSVRARNAAHATASIVSTNSASTRRPSV
jgi:hypothetical protein